MLPKRMQTSRAQLDRLLDPDNESVTLGRPAQQCPQVSIGASWRCQVM